jgi:transcriptional regulator with XRE-family HTH domain
MDILQNIGRRIRVFRTEKGYTQEDMAELLNKSVSWYAKVERGQLDINVSNIESIAKIFELSAGDLIKSAEVNIFNNTVTTINGSLNQGNITVQEANKVDAKKNIEVLLEDVLNRIEQLEITKS